MLYVIHYKIEAKLWNMLKVIQKYVEYIQKLWNMFKVIQKYESNVMAAFNRNHSHAVY